MTGFSRRELRALSLGGIATMRFVSMLSLVAIVSEATAQQVGTYDGQTEDGHWMSFTVDLNNDTGNFRLTTFSYDYASTCRKTGELDGNITFGLYDDIINGEVPLSFPGSDFYLSGKLVFQGTDVAKGTMSHRRAIFVPAIPPKQSDFCILPKESFNATWAFPGARTMMPRGAIKEGAARVDR